ncbi:MAG: hypothetical protein PUE14_03370 [Clostridia bacterium]|nr:hypothetical protein [Clostridia bacterium]
MVQNSVECLLLLAMVCVLYPKRNEKSIGRALPGKTRFLMRLETVSAFVKEQQAGVQPFVILLSFFARII